MRRRKASSVARGVRKRGARNVCLRAQHMKGTVTALCSQPETTTLSPFETRLDRAMFSAWVAFIVNTTFSGPGQKQLGQQAAAVISSFGSQQRGLVPAPAWACHAPHGSQHPPPGTLRGFNRLVAALSR